MTRDELKKYINAEIKEDNKSYILNLPTGYGKSALSLHIVNKIKGRNPKVLLLIAEKAHRNNWKLEIEKYLKKKIDLRIECYQSLHKLKDSSFDIVIADEAHHLNTDKRLQLFYTISLSYSIFLSATFNKKFKELLSSRYNSIEFSVDLQTAIDNNTLPTPRILILYSDIPKTDSIYELRIGRTNNPLTIRCKYYEYRKVKLKNPNATIIASATFEECCKYYKSLRKYYAERKAYDFSRATRDKYLRAVLNEKRFLGENKTNILIGYAQKFRQANKRFLIFSTSINQAEKIGNALTSKSKNQSKIINDFNEGLTNELITVNMLQEGQNLVNTEVGFIAQVDASDRSMIQKT